VINNIIKHAKADTVSVRIHGDELVDLVTIADNGIGFVQDKLKEKGLGLSNIASRAALIGGQVTIDSVLNQGTSITFALPKINKNV
jgi:signal transduction histidine kinase